MGHLNISIFSIISSLILFNIASIIIIMKRKNTAFIAKYSINLLLLSTLLAFLRLLFPIDLYYAQIINIHKILLFFLNHFLLYNFLIILLYIRYY